MINLINKIKSHPDYHKVGMILCHNGVVRETSRDGRSVKGLTVYVDQKMLHDAIESHKRHPGIIDIQVQIFDNQFLSIGDDVMYLIVAGDIRDHVIHTLESLLNYIKTQVTQKNELFNE